MTIPELREQLAVDVLPISDEKCATTEQLRVCDTIVILRPDDSVVGLRFGINARDGHLVLLTFDRKAEDYVASEVRDLFVSTWGAPYTTVATPDDQLGPNRELVGKWRRGQDHAEIHLERNNRRAQWLYIILKNETAFDAALTGRDPIGP